MDCATKEKKINGHAVSLVVCRCSTTATTPTPTPTTNRAAAGGANLPNTSSISSDCISSNKCSYLLFAWDRMEVLDVNNKP